MRLIKSGLGYIPANQPECDINKTNSRRDFPSIHAPNPQKKKGALSVAFATAAKSPINLNSSKR